MADKNKNKEVKRVEKLRYIILEILKRVKSVKRGK